MPRKPQPTPYNGALVVDKPRGKTSHDAVEAVRRMIGFRQVGHLGTLDPLGTGVLVLLLGCATRLARFYSGRRKRYNAGFRFGFATDTYDADGRAQGPDTLPQLDPSTLERLASERTGRFEQIPPRFSAKKIHGRPAYEYARKQEPVELKPVEVEIYEYKLAGIEGTLARFVIECSSGAYIRTLAHEMGQALGCGAHLAEITRTAVGEFTLDQAIPLAALDEAAKAGRFGDYVIPLGHLLRNFPSINVLPLVERRVYHGTRFNVPLAQIQPGRVETPPGATSQLDSGQPSPPRLRVFNQREELIAIAEAVVPRTYQPIVVFEPLS
jgi:tRNA pseudouridine55 synthase